MFLTKMRHLGLIVATQRARIHANWLGSVPDKLQHRACTVVWQRAMALSMSTNMRCAHRNRTVKLAARSPGHATSAYTSVSQTRAVLLNL